MTAPQATQPSTWVDDVIAVYGPAKLTSDGREPIKLRDDEGDHIKRFWVWFPANQNHHISIKQYSRWDNFAERTTFSLWVVSIGSHLSRMASIEWRSRTEPTDEDMRFLLGFVGFTGTVAAGEVAR